MASVESSPPRLLDDVLLEKWGSDGLAGVAKDRRLCLGNNPVSLTRLDLAALVLTDLAVSEGRSLTLGYPVPAGEAAVLLAAQVLIHAFLNDLPIQAVGLVTADPHLAQETWNDLNLVSPGVRAKLSEAFPAWRADPDGTSPVGRRFRGIMIGRQPGDWRVRATVVEHLSGPIRTRDPQATIRLIADPISPVMESDHEESRLFWGWDERVLKVLEGDETRPSTSGGFSPVAQRVKTMAEGVACRAIVCRHQEAETRLADLRDDLRTLSNVVERLDKDHLLMGLRAAWGHATTLASLPCVPSHYDEHTGVPPIAARHTGSFAKEIEAWAKTLPDDTSDYAHVVASDLADLRAAMEKDNPFVRELAAMANQDVPTLIVVRTRTAARALADELGHGALEFGSVRISWLSQLHKEGSWDRVVAVGPPPRSALHRLESGLGRDLSVLVLGDAEEGRLGRALSFLRHQRAEWVLHDQRAEVWHQLTRIQPPPQLDLGPAPSLQWETTSGSGFLEEPDPFSPIKDLMVDDRPLWDGEARGWRVATDTGDGDWRGAVRAVRVVTGSGTILLDAEKEVEVRELDRLKSVTASELEEGDLLLLGRREGRMNLIEALQETLERTRPDLVAANLIMRDYKMRVVSGFFRQGGDVAAFTDRMRILGCTKNDQTIKSWVRFSGPMGPRDFEDHLKLNRALELGLSETRLEEVFAGITRIRTFRRKAGRVLANAAAAATATGSVEDETLSEFGLGVADLRDAVIEVEVRSVEELSDPVPVSAMNNLRESSDDG